MAEARIPTMAHLFSFLFFVLWISEGASFSIHKVSKRNRISENRDRNLEILPRAQLNTKELCLLRNCVDFKGLEFASCLLTCTENALEENEVSEDDAHLRRQVDPLQSCIEAKCSQVFSYSDCVYSQCIMGLRLGFKKFSKKRNENPTGFLHVVDRYRYQESQRETKSGEKGLRRMRKKSWNDPSDACIAFHCGGKTPGSMMYSICVNNKCGSSYER